jgi:hypothetical protein
MTMSQPRLFEDEFDFGSDVSDHSVSAVAEGSWNYNHVLVGIVVGGLIVAIWFIAGSMLGGRDNVGQSGATGSQFESRAPVAMNHTENAAGSNWEQIHERLADQSIVPTGTPLGFYLVLFVVVVIVVLAVGLVIKVLRSTAFWTAIVVALILVVVHAWHTGKLKEIRWGQEHLKSTPPTGTTNR